MCLCGFWYILTSHHQICWTLFSHPRFSPLHTQKCPSGYTSRPADTFLIELSVLSQTLVEGVFPDISGDDADIYTCPEGFKYINLEGPIQSCIGNNARNPRFALVNGVAEFVCKNQARRRFICTFIVWLVGCLHAYRRMPTNTKPPLPPPPPPLYAAVNTSVQYNRTCT